MTVDFERIDVETRSLFLGYANTSAFAHILTEYQALQQKKKFPDHHLLMPPLKKAVSLQRLLHVELLLLLTQVLTHTTFWKGWEGRSIEE